MSLRSLRTHLPDVGLLVLRLGLGGIMVAHGYGKLANFEMMAAQFADPFGFGLTASLVLAIFAEFFCSIGVMLGLATRIATIPLIVTMSTAVFIIHANDAFAKKQPALLFLVGFVALLLLGPGKLSVDHFIARWWSRRNA